MSLTSLIISKGSTVAATIAATEIDAVLFDRIEAGRQAMPERLAVSIAAHLGVSYGEVAGEVSRVTTTGALSAYNAVPAQVLLGDRLPPVLLHPIDTLAIEPQTPPVPPVGEWVWITSNGNGDWPSNDYLYIVDVVNETLVGAHNLSSDAWPGPGILRASGLAYDADGGQVLCMGHDELEGAWIARYTASTGMWADTSFANYGAQWGCDWGVTEGFWKGYWTPFPNETGIMQLDESTVGTPMTVLATQQFSASPDAYEISLNVYEDGFTYSLVFDPAAGGGFGNLYWEKVDQVTGAGTIGGTNFIPAVGLGTTTYPIVDQIYTLGVTTFEVYGLNVAKIETNLWTYAAGDPTAPPASLPLYKTDMSTLVTTPVATVGVDVPGCWLGGCVVDDDGNLWVTSMKGPGEVKTIHVHKLDTAGNVLAAYEMPSAYEETVDYAGICVFAAGTVWVVYRVTNGMTEQTTLNLGKLDKATAALVSSVVLHVNFTNPRGGLDIITTDVGPLAVALPGGTAF